MKWAKIVPNGAFPQFRFTHTCAMCVWISHFSMYFVLLHRPLTISPIDVNVIKWGSNDEWDEYQYFIYISSSHPDSLGFGNLVSSFFCTKTIGKKEWKKNIRRLIDESIYGKFIIIFNRPWIPPSTCKKKNSNLNAKWISWYCIDYVY